jgi:hypothetical protein
MGHMSIRFAVFVLGLSLIVSPGCLNLGEGTQENLSGVSESTSGCSPRQPQSTADG